MLDLVEFAREKGIEEGKTFFARWGMANPHCHQPVGFANPTGASFGEVISVTILSHLYSACRSHFTNITGKPD